MHNRLFFAELLIDIGKKKEALKHLDFILEKPINPDHEIEDGNYRKQARKMRSKLI